MNDEGSHTGGLSEKRLLDCYATVRKYLVCPEPESAIAAVDGHRQYWRPIRTRLILLAESHVYTTATEVARKVKPPVALPVDQPDSFVRLVYCLGYGEDAFLDQPVTSPRNAGTPQFWKLFYSCLNPIEQNADFASILKGQSAPACRFSAKLQLLRNLQESGIWLVDASIAALYGPGGAKPSYPNYLKALAASWDGYVKDIIANVAPEGILCIGKGVRSALRDRLDALSLPWGAMPQPQARLSALEGQQVFRAMRAVSAEPGRVSELTQAWAV